MATNRKAKGNQTGNAQDISSIVQGIHAIRSAVEQYNVAVEQYKVKNPDIDVELILSKQKEFLPVLGMLSNRELDKFITHAKKQGTKMNIHEMEMGILAAGRTDMQNGLAEILDSLKFDKPICPECNEKMENRGRSKKKL
jgi:predicted methyltransferase MtxX (methanogen marker protein 4)